MANEQNLIPNSERTPKERADRAAKMGRASGTARRKRKAMRTVLNELLTLPAECEEALTAMEGIGVEGADNQAAMLAGLLKAAMAGDVKAVQEIRNILGESRDTAAEKAERKARTEKLQTDTALQKAKLNDRGAGEQPENNLFEKIGEALDELRMPEQEAVDDNDMVEDTGADAP